MGGSEFSVRCLKKQMDSRLWQLKGTATRNAKNSFMHEFGKKQKVLEINPRSPTIQGLLRRVKGLPAEDEERDIEAEDELKEVTSVLTDGALVRSGFHVPDSHE